MYGAVEVDEMSRLQLKYCREDRFHRN
jgi:hypothetical protein